MTRQRKPSITIDPEFRAMIPPLTVAERAALKVQIQEAGRALNPILTWRGIIVDGHNRYDLCTELGLPYETRELDPSPINREAVKRWMFEHQAGRRNLSVDQQCMLAAVRGVEVAALRGLIKTHWAAEIAAEDPDLAQAVLAGTKTLQQAHNDLENAKRGPRAYTPRGPRVAAVAPEAPSLSPLEAHEAKLGTSKLRGENRALLDELKEHRERAAALDALTSSKLPPVKRRELKSSKREGCAVIMASDWHVEEIVDAGASPLGNVYTPDVAAQRCGRFFAGAKWLIDLHRPVFGLRDVVLWLGGDLLTGYIHDELKETNALSPTEALLWLKAHLIDGIQQLLADGEIERLLVPCSYGNHGRTTLKPRRATGGKNSWEWLLYMDLKREFGAGGAHADKRVEFIVEQSAHQYVRVYDFDLHFHHGDEISYGGGVGGITIPINKATAQWDKVKRCHYHHFGHFHQYLDLGQTVVNGSVIGYNAFAMSIKATPEPPQQAFYVLDSKRGKTCKSPIWVSE